jgi:hypothetical protein
MIVLQTNETQNSNERSRRNAMEEPFAGLWKDRVDLKESSSWIRNLRKKEWRD